MSDLESTPVPVAAGKDRCIEHLDRLRVSQGPAMKRWIIRCYEKEIGRVDEALGIRLDLPLLSAESDRGRHILRLSPDEWLYMQNPEAPVFSQTDRGFEAVSIVEVSARQVALKVQGVKCEYALSTLCPIDLVLSVFPVGACTRTVFGRSEIILWRQAREQFHIEVARSFSDYIWLGLEAAKKDIAYFDEASGHKLAV